MDHPKLKAPWDECDQLKFTNSSGSTIASGTWRIQGTVLGMVMRDVEDGAEGIMCVYAPYPGILAPKVDSVTAFGVGARVYWDIADGELNGDSTNNDAVGYAVVAALATDAEVQIVLQNSVPVA
jgi:predicted RecA/RadA family phage recombinase